MNESVEWKTWLGGRGGAGEEIPWLWHMNLKGSWALGFGFGLGLGLGLWCGRGRGRGRRHWAQARLTDA